jgi:CubicO group peptidase (beta-lactamase class C family)
MSRFLNSQNYLMKSLGFVLLFGFISLGAIGGCNNDADNGADVQENDLESRIDAFVQCEMFKKNIPGLSLSIVKDGEVLLQKGYGKADIENEIDVTPETLFALASITKVFTAIGVLQFLDQGQIELDDPIGMYIPDLPNTEWNIRTIRDLLSMSSGIPDDGIPGGEVNFPEVLEVVAKYDGICIRYSPPRNTISPGICANPAIIYSYSNTNFLILGDLINRISTQKDYESYINDSILTPLDMTSTQPNNLETPPSGLAINYDNKADNDDPDAVSCSAQSMPPENCIVSQPPDTKCRAEEIIIPPLHSFSSGWLVTNQKDMVKFEKALHDLSPVLLKSETYELMWTNREFINGKFDPFGLGWAVCPEENEVLCIRPVDPEAGGDNVVPESLPVDFIGKVVSKDGALPGFMSSITRNLDDGITVIVLINSRGILISDLAAEIAQIVRDFGDIRRY